MTSLQRESSERVVTERLDLEPAGVVTHGTTLDGFAQAELTQMHVLVAARACARRATVATALAVFAIGGTWRVAAPVNGQLRWSIFGVCQSSGEWQAEQPSFFISLANWLPCGLSWQDSQRADVPRQSRRWPFLGCLS